MKKKGQLDTVVIMLIILVSIVALLMIYKLIFQKTNDVLTYSDCSKSINAHLLTRGLTKEILISNINCQTRYPLIKENNPKNIKMILADEMRTCWDTWKRGEKELFSDEGVYCHVCAIPEFKNKKLKIENFDQFLIRTSMITNNPEKLTYMEYFSGFESVSDETREKFTNNIVANDFNFEIDTAKPYAIIFYYNKDRDKIKEVLNVAASVAVGTTAGAVTGGVIGASIGAGTAGIICGFFSLGIGAIPCAITGAKAGAIIGEVVAGSIGAFTGYYLTDRNVPEWMSHIMIKEYTKDSLTSMGCSIAAADAT
ncbi:MAG: hypothetical protein ABIC91_01375 [Nanoarchaeota archaeon]|nr:hypothetical protein [Nanoarchaeota archaeon]MBU1029868.1 hypothetical protein [Nanoarchaeota archaeon]MBU1849282.1 hypothetical protein [Nanoarchaeota archaeon]